MNKDTNFDFQNQIPTRISSKVPKKRITLNSNGKPIYASKQASLYSTSLPNIGKSSFLNDDYPLKYNKNDHTKLKNKKGSKKNNKIHKKPNDYTEPKMSFKKVGYNENKYSPNKSPISISERSLISISDKSPRSIVSDKSPISISDKSFNKVDMTKNKFFNNTNSSIGNLSSTSNDGHTYNKNYLIKNTRNSLSLVIEKSNVNISDNINIESPKNDHYQTNVQNLPSPISPSSNKIKMENPDLKKVDISNNYNSGNVLESYIISPAKDEKFTICSNPVKGAFDIGNTNNLVSNYSLSNDDDGCFVYSSTEQRSSTEYDYTEYRNLLKSKTYIPESPIDEDNRLYVHANKRKESLFNNLAKHNNYENSKSKAYFEYPVTPSDSENESIRSRSLPRPRRGNRDSEIESFIGRSLSRNNGRDSEIESYIGRSLSRNNGRDSEVESFRSYSLPRPGKGKRDIENEINKNYSYFRNENINNKLYSLSRTKNDSKDGFAVNNKMYSLSRNSEVDSIGSYSLPRPKKGVRDSEVESFRSHSSRSMKDGELGIFRSLSLSQKDSRYSGGTFGNRSLSRNLRDSENELFRSLSMSKVRKDGEIDIKRSRSLTRTIDRDERYGSQERKEFRILDRKESLEKLKYYEIHGRKKRDESREKMEFNLEKLGHFEKLERKERNESQERMKSRKDKMEPRIEKVVTPIEIIAPPIEIMEPRVEKMEPRIEKMVPLTKKNVPPIDRMVPRKEKIIPPIEIKVPPIEKMELRVEKIQPRIEKMKPRIEVMVSPKETTAPPIERMEPRKEKMQPRIEKMMLPKEKMQPRVEKMMLPKEKMQPRIEKMMLPKEKMQPRIEITESHIGRMEFNDNQDNRDRYITKNGKSVNMNGKASPIGGTIESPLNLTNGLVQNSFNSYTVPISPIPSPSISISTASPKTNSKPSPRPSPRPSPKPSPRPSPKPSPNSSSKTSPSNSLNSAQSQFNSFINPYNCMTSPLSLTPSPSFQSPSITGTPLIAVGSPSSHKGNFSSHSPLVTAHIQKDYTKGNLIVSSYPVQNNKIGYPTVVTVNNKNKEKNKYNIKLDKNENKCKGEIENENQNEINDDNKSENEDKNENENENGNEYVNEKEKEKENENMNENKNEIEDKNEDKNKNRNVKEKEKEKEIQSNETIDEICNRKKFSQDLTGINILESILNKPIDDSFDFLNYKRISDVQKIDKKKLDNQKYTTIGRFPSQRKNRNKTKEFKKRSSYTDINKKGHKYTQSEGNLKGGNKRNIFNIFSNHKKNKSNSANSPQKINSNYDKILLDEYERLISGDESFKMSLPSNNDNGKDTSVNNEKYKNYKINQQQLPQIDPYQI